jgi:nucleoside phosphorylase
MAPQETPRLNRGCYTIGWICPLPLEMTAAMSMLDETHQKLPQSDGDSNTYVLGRIHDHDIVLACLPEMGTNPAAKVAQQMKQSFPDLRCALLVGIGGAIPTPRRDIRLGDVVVGIPGSKYGAVVQWDYGKTGTAGKFIHRGILSDPPAVLLAAVNTLRARYDLGQSSLVTNLGLGLSRIISGDTRDGFTRPPGDADVLYQPDYDHSNSEGEDCRDCDTKRTVPREPRSPQTQLRVHFGTIASGNQVIGHGRKRDEIGAEFNALCLEMEAAGIVKDLPCIVIRGISDYSDSHKNASWKGHAALAAAALARDLLSVLPSRQVNDILDPGYLFDRGPRPLPISGSSLHAMAREEGRYGWQAYWHKRQPVVDPNSAKEAETLRLDQARLQNDAEREILTLEMKLADFMQEYASALQEQIEDFTNPMQRRAVFAAMLRMTKGSIYEDSSTKRTLLHWLAMNGVSEPLPKLVDVGFDVEHKDSDWQTPLHLAVIGNHFDAADVLVRECGADVHAMDLNGLLPWHHALHIDWDSHAQSEERDRSRISIIKLLARVTDEDKVRGGKALRDLQQLKGNPDADLRLF